MRFLSLFLPEIKIRSIGLFRVSLVENIIIPQGVVDMDKRIATIIGTNLQRLRTQRGLTQELYDLADSLGVSVDYLLYPEQPDARIRNIEALLRDKPESFIIAVERLVRLCIEEFSGLE